jgi:hypothetical protein
MQPSFPSDHHFYDRRRRPAAAARESSRTADLAALTEYALDYLTRQCLPAFDASDPRGQTTA